MRNPTSKQLTFLPIFCAIFAIVTAFLGDNVHAQSGTLEPSPVIKRFRGADGIAPDPKPLSFKVNYVYRPDGRGPLKDLTEGAVLHSGDHYKLQFTPEEDSYVYIFQLDSSRAMYTLFPMDSFNGVVVNNRNPVKGGVTYYVPAKDKSFQLDEQVGTELIYFLASRLPDQDLEQWVQRLQKAHQRKETGIDLIAVKLVENFKFRGVAGIVPDPQQTSTIPWDDNKQFTLPAWRLNDLCAKCVSMLSFKHR